MRFSPIRTRSALAVINGIAVFKGIAVGAVLSLLALPASAYRTGGELDELSETKRVKWPRDGVSFVLNLESAPSDVEGGVADVMLEAMRVWNEPMCSSLELQPSGVTRNEARAGDNVNTITFVRDWADRGFSDDSPGTTDVQYQRVDDEDWTIAEADIYLDARANWRLRPSSNASDEEFDLLSVLVHEFGHAAGLLHPCEPGGRDGAPNCNSKDSWEEYTMYPFYSPDQATLETDDERGVCCLYEQETCEDFGCDTGYECTERGCERLCGSEVCDVGSVCVDDECVEPCSGIECTNPACEEDDDCPDSLLCNGKYCVPGLGALGDPCATPRDCNSEACSKDGICLPACEHSRDCNPDCEAAKAALLSEAEKTATAAGEDFDPDDVDLDDLPECEDTVACRSGVDGSRVCVPDLGAMGDECEESNQCLGEQCIADAAETPVCTRRCGEGHPECPLDWTCDLVEGRAVCVPPQNPANGCSIAAVGATAPSRNPWTFGVMASVFAISLFGARRRKRTEARRC